MNRVPSEWKYSADVKFYSLRECSFTAERLNTVYACVCPCALVLAQAHTHTYTRARVDSYIRVNT